MGDLCLQDGQKFALIGDSITDAGRRDMAPPFGVGYVSLLRTLVIGGWPERDIAWVNRGISGNCVTDLRDRWQDDVIGEQPDWLSVKIGINDLHGYLRDGDSSASPASFREIYREILSQATAETHARLILITPFYISTDHSGQSFASQVLDLLAEYISVVEDLAGEFHARLVRLQPMFEKQLRYRSADEFCPEPVPPLVAGHLLIAQEVLRVLCE